MSRNGVNNNGPALPPGITAEIWEQMKKQQRRGPVPPVTDGQQEQSAPVHRKQQQQQAQVQAKGQQINSGKQAKTGKRVAVQIRESNPVAVSKTGSYEAIEIDSGVGNESNDEWKTVSRKGNRKKAAGDEAPAASVEKVANAVNGMQIAGDKKKKKKKQTPPAAKSDEVVLLTKSSVPASAQSAVSAGRKGSADSGKKKKSAGVDQPSPQQQESEQDGDPVKRLRNLKKRLKEIEALRQMDKSTLGPDQVEKVKRYHEVKKQIATLESRVN